MIPTTKILPNNIIFPEVGKLLEEGKQVEISPKGRSMRPFIWEGRDSVILEKRPSLEVGDIVLAEIGEKYILHRVLKIDGDSIILMGDGNIKGTEKCRRGDVMGTVAGIKRKNGRILKPTKGCLWRRLLPIRRYLLYIFRKIYEN